jgi:hypothetical protein
MALQKTLIDPNTGATANYWKVSSVTLNTNSVSFVICGYVSQETRSENKTPIDHRLYSLVEHPSFTCEGLDASEINPIKAAYLYLKTTNEFLDAVDV